jgi:hypothetical protein
MLRAEPGAHLPGVRLQTKIVKVPRMILHRPCPITAANLTLVVYYYQRNDVPSRDEYVGKRGRQGRKATD